VDDFADGSATDDWTTYTETWSVVNGAAQNATSTSGPVLYQTVTDDEIELRYAYSIDSYTSATPLVAAQFRYNSATGERLNVRFRLDQAELRYYNGSVWTTYANTAATTTAGTRYNVRIEADGAHVRVWRSTGGGLETQIFNVTSVPTYNGVGIHFIVNMNMVASIDNVMLIADDVSRTATFTPATNNELASVSDYNGSTAYAYDARGRTSTETKNSVTKTYSWTMANLLAGVDSSASGDTDVSYFYTGDLKRIWRLENGSLKNSYKWDAGFNVSEETDWVTSKTKTYADGLAEVDVTGT
jgi:YD repeat-containing protein